ncbi:MAG: nucleotide-binding protein [Catenulispora sp.]|nr:nucleotide-binding protein [Catenulispora sp.]
MTEHGPITHHGTGNISVGNSGTQTQGHRSPIYAPPETAASPKSGTPPREADAPATPDKTRSVFVVHGRDEQATEAVFELLRTLDLVPLEWERLVAATGHAVPFLGDVVHRATEVAQAALVLLTPDDVVALHGNLHEAGEPYHETHETCQPRPNVLIELGMVLAVYPERTIIAQAGAIRPIADIAGRNFVRVDGSEQALRKLAERLKVAGCAVDDSGLRRVRLAAFQGWDAYHRQP